MSNAVIHAERSAAKWGGEPAEYLAIHKFLDQAKSHIGDNRHRIILHNAWGIDLACQFFGDSITNSEGRRVFVKDIAELHVADDLGFIPSLSDCLASTKPEPWLSGALSRAEKSANRIPNESSVP